MTTSALDALKQQLREFAAERDWERFHSPKNLSMALTAEAAELVEHFQWLREGAAPPADTLDEVAQEVADVLIYLVRFADQLDIDLLDAVARKMAINATRFPPVAPPPGDGE
jgi:NTP pyrophosphatase (non-canonical NTP hydrolase)